MLSIAFLLKALPTLFQMQPANTYSPKTKQNTVLTCSESRLKLVHVFVKPYTQTVRICVALSFSIVVLSVHQSPFLYLFFFFFFLLSLNLKSKICLNWLQRARGGFVSMLMRVLIGPEAHAANRPLLVCRGPLLAR